MEYQTKTQEGYHVPILNEAQPLQSQNMYNLPNNQYSADSSVSQSQGVSYQSSSQQASVPLDVRDSMCPTEGHCQVCHRLCMMRK